MTDKSRKEQIEEMLAAEPGDAFLLYALAMEYVSAGDDEAALAEFNRLLTDSPDYVPGFLQAGQALIRLGRHGEARSILQRGIDVARRTGDDHAAEEMAEFLHSLPD